MSIRHGLLALLSEQAMQISQLKAEFERRTGGTWPVNIGQVFTTLQRLERDDLVEKVPHLGAAEPERFRLTAAGAAEATAWWSRPVGRGAPARDELAIKLALAVTARGVDVRSVVQGQRTETMRALHDLTRLKSLGGDRQLGEGSGARGATSAEADLAWSLVLDHLVFAAEAEVRWLDHVEARVSRAAGTGTSAQGADAPAWPAPHSPAGRVPGHRSGRAGR
ncbi:MAG TPA: helix-turn-helix transcriptional regulator [Actinotalea sp.]|nr:helix-turn-helix transcriptional regulator [Actinotalea sp.]